MGAYVPPGWPEAVRPPGSEDFEPSAVAWLLDVLPTEYRQHEVLRRYPVALASMAGYYADGCVEGARRGYRTCRRELAELVPPHAVDGVLAAYRQEGFRLVATAREVGLVGAALRGETFPQGSDGRLTESFRQQLGLLLRQTAIEEAVTAWPERAGLPRSRPPR